MARYKVMAVVGSEELRLDIRDRLIGDEDIALVGFPAADADIITKIKGYAPHAVIISEQGSDTAPYELAQSIYEGFPGCAIVLILESMDIQSVTRAMQAGIRQVVAKEDLSGLKDAIVKAARLEQNRTVGTHSDPRVVSFYSGRGGSGKTTLAFNSAVSLALAGHRTILIDLNLAFGDASILLNIKTKDTISELVMEKSSFTIYDIRSFSMQHPTGISFMSAPASPEHAEYVTARHVELLISQLRPYYDFIIIDLPCDISDTTIAAIEGSDLVIMVTKKDISGLKTTKQMMDIFKTLQFGERLRFLLNFDKRSVLTQKEMENVLEAPFNYVLPEDDKAVRYCRERGTAFTYEMPRSQISRAVQKMASSWIEDAGREETK